MAKLKIVNFLRLKTIYLKKFLKRNFALSKQSSTQFILKGRGRVRNRQRVKLFNLKTWQYLASLLTRRELILLRLFLVIFTVAAGWLLVNIVAAMTVTGPARGGVYTEGVVGTPRFVNPLYATINPVDRDLVKLVYAGLVKFNKDHELVPDLAENWVITDDEKVYTFNLRRDITWPNGEPFTARDVVFTIESIQDESYNSPLRPSFASVEVELVDEQTVKFVLKEPFAPFLESLTVGILPQYLWSQIAPANATLASLNLKPVGLGPFVFKSLIKDQQGVIKAYVLERNENYHHQPPYLDKLVFKFYPDVESSLAALTKGNVDGLSFLPKEKRTEIKRNTKIKLQSLILPQYTAVFFNTRQSPGVLKDRLVRQALSFGVDRKKLVEEVLEGEGLIIHGPVLPGYPGYHPDIKKYSFNLEEAGRLLDQAGWRRVGDNQFRKKEGKTLELTLTTVNQTENVKTAQLLQQFWQTLGVKVNLQLIEPSRIQREIIRPRAYEALLFGEIIGLDPDPYPFWHSSQIKDPGLNLAMFADKQADQVLEEARRISDPQRRADKYIHFQNILAPQAAAVFLYSPTYTYVLGEKLKGFPLRRILNPADRFTGVEEWYIKTKRRLK